VFQFKVWKIGSFPALILTVCLPRSVHRYVYILWYSHYLYKYVFLIETWCRVAILILKP
jgi:hypothetical protein